MARSQRDPLAADETAPQGVLQSVDEVRIEMMTLMIIEELLSLFFLCIEFHKAVPLCDQFHICRTLTRLSRRNMAFILMTTMTTYNI